MTAGKFNIADLETFSQLSPKFLKVEGSIPQKGAYISSVSYFGFFKPYQFQTERAARAKTIPVVFRLDCASSFFTSYLFQSLAMLRLTLTQRITNLYEAEQHVYSIPIPGESVSDVWIALPHERRHNLRTKAVSLWRDYLESDGRLSPHPHIAVPEYRKMLTQPDGELIIEEA